MDWLPHFRLNLSMGFETKLRRAEQETSCQTPADGIRLGRELSGAGVGQGLLDVDALLEEWDDPDAVLELLGIDPEEAHAALSQWAADRGLLAGWDPEDDESGVLLLSSYRSALMGVLVGLVLHRQTRDAAPSAAGGA